MIKDLPKDILENKVKLNKFLKFKKIQDTNNDTKPQFIYITKDLLERVILKSGYL